MEMMMRNFAHPGRLLIATALLFTVGCGATGEETSPEEPRAAPVDTEPASEERDDADRCVDADDRLLAAGDAIGTFTTANLSTFAPSKTLAVSALSSYLAPLEDAETGPLAAAFRDGSRQLRTLEAMTAGGVDHVTKLEWAGDTLDVAIAAQTYCLETFAG
jgi:hypothetical protein